MKKILITGASGFVGSFLVEEALRQGLDVYAGIRKTSSKKYLQIPNTKFFEVNFDNPDWMLEQLESQQFDYIIHNAGVTTARTPDVYFKVNTQYTNEFVDNVNKLSKSPEKFVYISSAAAFGAADHTKSGVLSNSEEPKPETPYGESKLKAERYLVDKLKVPHLIFRPAGIFGPRDTDIFLVFKNMKYRFSPRLGYKEQRLGLIYVKDLTRIIIQSCLSDISNKAYFASDGNAYSTEVFNKSIADAMGVKALDIVLPKSLVRGIAHLSDAYAKITKSTTPLTVDKAKILLADSWECDISELQRDYNFKAEYDIETAVKETADWYKANDWL